MAKPYQRKRGASGAPSTRHRNPSDDGRKEIKYYGVSACRAVWAHRPQDIIRIYLHTSRVHEFRDVLKWAAEQRKAYHVVENEDLEKVTGSIHHQGVCLLALEHRFLDFATLKQQLRKSPAGETLVYLDGVENPHNLGAIVRSCAHFGVPYVLGARGRLPRLSPSAVRVAEGGAEMVGMVYVNEGAAALRQLKRLGYGVVATSVSSGTALYDYRAPDRVVVVVGAEETGVSKELLNEADSVLRVPGTGAVESLNVSVALAVIAAEFYRQRQAAAH